MKRKQANQIIELRNSIKTGMERLAALRAAPGATT